MPNSDSDTKRRVTQERKVVKIVQIWCRMSRRASVFGANALLCRYLMEAHGLGIGAVRQLAKNK